MNPDLDYENGAFIPGGKNYPSRWQEEAAEWRQLEHALGRARLNIPYGEGERQAFDLFFPAGRPRGVVVFIHGGYWRRFDRKTWSHFAAGSTARGFAVAMPSYTLAPEARISDVTREMVAALQAVAAEVADVPLVVTGHSAGGHLSARMVCNDVPLAEPVRARLARSVPISPLSDLRPLMKTSMNEDLRLSAAEAAAESPVLCEPDSSVPVTVWVGSEERPAFLDQARWLEQAWPNASMRIAPGRHHFDIIDMLREPGSPLVESLVGGL